MAGAVSRRSTLTLYSLCNCCHCHRVRLVLLEKGLDAEFVWVSPASPPPDFLDANPGGQLPTLVDRDVVLYNDRVIIEYLDEIQPEPSLLPGPPADRARIRAIADAIVSAIRFPVTAFMFADTIGCAPPAKSGGVRSVSRREPPSK